MLSDIGGSENLRWYCPLSEVDELMEAFEDVLGGVGMVDPVVDDGDDRIIVGRYRRRVRQRRRGGS